MKGITRLLAGLTVGASLGAVLVALFAPETGTAFRKRLRSSYQETLDEARQASLERQAELEAQLARLQGKSP